MEPRERDQPVNYAVAAIPMMLDKRADDVDDNMIYVMVGK